MSTLRSSNLVEILLRIFHTDLCKFFLRRKVPDKIDLKQTSQRKYGVCSLFEVDCIS